ncbi:hypothetical protein AVEN_271533-1 [Araneus ventricosus]|uniref:Retrotransposon gag domain-containing protein n=1 Tax=Araneus ventricosus TaxID=182803 RepID=A0A4Y2G1R2_ARAVE|nr:hypothetical protein AVEN_271533-1 [Araneus ventricosus]
MRRFACETGAASLGNDETSATRSGYTTLPRVNSAIKEHGRLTATAFDENDPSVRTGFAESVQLPVHNVYQPNISFSDIERIIVPFDGDSHQSVEKWIELFEDVVNMFNLSDLYKLVFGKRSLKGKAKLYIQSETSVNCWEKLKFLLLSEFDYSCNSAELQEMLSKRKLKDNESLEEYVLNMKQLRNRGNIKDSALI